MLDRLILLFSLVAAVVIFAMMNFTTPTNIGPVGVLVFFTAVYIVAFGVATLFVRLLINALRKKVGNKRYYYAAVGAFGPIMLILAQSFGIMNPLTAIGVVIFVAAGCFVVNKRL